MSSSVTIVALAAGLAGFSLPAADVPTVVVRVAGDCSAAAAQVVAETGGELLSAQPTADGKCVVTVLIPGNGGRPKKVTVKVPM
ncbi:two-component system FeuPQ modulator FeuN [Ensifer sp. BR816]|uniref:two-component system FeuPQ modulator FeuN n=1 Tax=Rhizobium sp. (strain BR816) TaxID=1057002 RepID=UPI0003725F53|nr:two-component system FeuPQ modulator FeuN [Ensifer sp. BR816]